MKFCSHCGSARIALRIPEGDNAAALRLRATAARSTTRIPKIVVGCLPEWEDRVLLCKRAIEPRHGLWTLPAGFLENGETIVAGALRETLEEANARVEIGDLYTMISLPQISQVYMMFRARLARSRFRPRPREPRGAPVRRGRDSVGGARVPHDRRTLRNYFLDRKLGAFPMRVSTLVRKPPRPDVSGAA